MRFVWIDLFYEVEESVKSSRRKDMNYIEVILGDHI